MESIIPDGFPSAYPFFPAHVIVQIMKQPAVDLDLPVNGNTFVRPGGEPFWQFLREQGIEFKKKDFPFLTNHIVPQIKQVFDFPEYVSLTSRGEALAYLYQGLGKSLNYVGPVLDLELKHGFNDHTDRHTLWVSQTGVELLQRAGLSYDGQSCFDAETEVMMTLVGMTHDLGNFFSRKEHSTYSAWLLTKLFAGWHKRPELFNAALHTILFHEEPVLVKSGVKLKDGTPLQWALVAADKMHVGRDRIGGRSFESGVKNNALEDDIHILINALIVRSSWHLGAESFVWELDFSVEQLGDRFRAFTRGGNNRIWMPKAFQKIFIKGGKRWRDSFTEIFLEIYKNRMEMAAESVFLLFPFIKSFRIRLSDNDVRGKVGSGEMEIWRKKRSTRMPKDKSNNSITAVKTGPQ